MTVAAPAPPASIETKIEGAGVRGYDLSNKFDLLLPHRDLGTLPSDGGGCDAIHVGNGQNSQRVTVSVSAGATKYGIYLGGVSDYLIHDGTITMTGGAWEHAFRGSGSRTALVNMTLDSTQSGKRSVWWYGSEIVLDGCHLKGTAMWIGATPDAFPGSDGVVVNRALVRDTRIEQTRADMPAAVGIYPGCQDIVFDRCVMSGPGGGRSVDIDSRRTGKVKFIRCTWNGSPITKASMGGTLTNVVIEN